MRVVDPEDPHPVFGPEQHDPQYLVVDALGVVVEVDRVDVLVLLRRVLRVGDRAVGAHGEPLRVRLDPRVVGRALQREVERDLHAEVVRARDERVEVVHRAQLGVDRVVPALGRPDRPRRADVAWPRVHGVVATLAVRGADGVDRGQVDHVEAHRRDPVELLGRGDERAVHRAAVLVAPAGGAREELVPGAELGAHPVDVDLQRPAPGDQLPDRALCHDRVHGREHRGRAAGAQRQGRVAQGVGRAEQQVAVRALGGAAAHPLQQPCAGLQVVGELLGALPGLELLRDGVAPRGPRVAPRVDAERPQPWLVGGHDGLEAVGAEAGLLHADVVGGAAGADLAPHDVGRDGVVALTPHRGPDGDDLADDGLGRMASVTHCRCDVVDTQPTGHRRTPV